MNLRLLPSQGSGEALTFEFLPSTIRGRHQLIQRLNEMLRVHHIPGGGP